MPSTCLRSSQSTNSNRPIALVLQPSDKNKYGTQVVAQEKELVFDIDMDDYASVRKCCTGKVRGWRAVPRLVAPARRSLTRAADRVQVVLGLHCRSRQAAQYGAPWYASLQYVLHHADITDTRSAEGDTCVSTEQFGFEHLLFVFSGRRGVHCWVADTAARQLSDRGRKAVVRYLSIVVRTHRIGSVSIERAREREHSPTRLPQTKDDNRISVSRNPHPFLQYVLLGSANHALRWRTNRMSLVS